MSQQAYNPYLLNIVPIFNVADASIFIGVAIILIFQNRFFPETKPEKVTPQPENEEGQ